MRTPQNICQVDALADFILSTAEFCCYQEDADGGSFQLWNLRKALFGHPAGSTVSRETLERAFQSSFQAVKNKHAMTFVRHRRGAQLHHLKTPTLCEGINRLQWEGKWLNPGVPARVAYFHTHWVAKCGDFVLCTATEPSAWIPESDWRDFLVNALKKPFHVTHHYAFPVA